jgi:hypothetical protein
MPLAWPGAPPERKDVPSKKFTASKPDAVARSPHIHKRFIDPLAS